MSIRIKITGLDKIAKGLESALRNTVSQVVMRDLAKLARDLIYKRTKDGYGVTSDSSVSPTKKRLNKLSPGYVLRRKGIVDFVTGEGKKVRFKTRLPQTGKFFSPGKSNLTFTGQLLDAMKIEARRNGFTLDIPPSGRRDDTLTNEDVAKYVSENGRPFFALTEKEQLVLARELETRVRQELKKALGSGSVR